MDKDRLDELARKLLTKFSEMLVKNNVGYYEELEIYKRLGFTDEEIDYFGLRDYTLEEELEKENFI